MNIRAILFAAFALVPEAARAASIAGSGCSSVMSSFQCFAQAIGNLLGLATAALIGIAIVIYFFGIVRNLFKAGGGSAQSFGSIRDNLVWGIIALFVVFSIWGIVGLLGNALFGT